MIKTFTNASLTETELKSLGQKIAEVLNLEPIYRILNEPIKYQTTWGVKTEVGLALTVIRVLEDGP
jgi:hypothetical protein